MGWMKEPSGAHKVDCAIFLFFPQKKTGTHLERDTGTSPLAVMHTQWKCLL